MSNLTLEYDEETVMAMPDVCGQVVKQYLTHLETDFASVEAEYGCIIITPFRRPDGETVEIVVEPAPFDRIRLTDMGDTLGYLYVNGMTLSRNLLANARKIGRPYGVSLDGSAFVIQPESNDEFGDAFHRLLQTLLSVTEMIQRRRPTDNVRFDREIESLLITTGNTYDIDYPVQGRRSVHNVRYHVNSDRRFLIQPLSPASESVALSWAERWAYRFRDIADIDDGWHFFVVLDDRGERAGVWTDRTLAPIEEYRVLWTQRERFEELVSRQSR